MVFSVPFYNEKDEEKGLGIGELLKILPYVAWHSSPTFSLQRGLAVSTFPPDVSFIPLVVTSRVVLVTDLRPHWVPLWESLD